MKQYTHFINQLQDQLDSFETTSKSKWTSDSTKLVDGLAAYELRRLVDLEIRREYGAFFTGSDLANDLLSNPELNLSENSVFYDPACGAGNLLIAAAKQLKSKGFDMSNPRTLLGTDIHSEFVQATRLRLKINETLSKNVASTYDYLNDVVIADGFTDNPFYKRASHILTNPPFNSIIANKEIKWGRGKISAAALFIDKIITNVNPGTVIVAILPDVLRSGSRYGRWRKMVETTCTVNSIKLLGQFDKFADVDVFSLILVKKKPQIVDEESLNCAWTSHIQSQTVLESKFIVSVGPVVDNRDLHEGPSLPFLISKGLEGWKQIKVINKYRRYKGKSYSGPFVVIKRTSRMGDKHRAIASIINMDSPVYVDNHLIVLQPKSGKIADCNAIVKTLQQEKTDNWIDDQIRCRHLTVKVVAKIPI